MARTGPRVEGVSLRLRLGLLCQPTVSALLSPILELSELDVSVRQALGKGGARFTGLVYVFIHYALLVAYMAQGGGLLNDAFKGVFDAGWVSSASPDVALTKAVTIAMTKTTTVAVTIIVPIR